MTAPAARIIVIGLGPGDPQLRTLGAQRVLDEADHIVLRTRIHPGIDDLVSDSRVTDCDDLYEIARGFDLLYPAIARRVLKQASAGGTVVFAVPGHPRFGEQAVPLIEAGARETGIPVEVLDAVSFVDASAGTLEIDPLANGLQVADAEAFATKLDRDPFASGLLGVDPARPLLVGQLYNNGLAAAVKIALARIYPDEHSVTLVRAAGMPSREVVQSLPLHELDRQDVNHLTSLWVPPLAPLEATRSPETLTRIVARLRAPGGCPWDREQTHASLRDSVLEEAYEVVDAIDSRDSAGLAEELGDLLLLIMMHVQIAEEDGAFQIENVLEGITSKLIRRHPHVFATATAETPDAVIATWEGVKASEREAKGESWKVANPVDLLPRSMPATRKVVKVLAPRALLREPGDPSAGDQVLSAVNELIDRGFDPERALEASLRKQTAQAGDGRGSLATAGAGTE